MSRPHARNSVCLLDEGMHMAFEVCTRAVGVDSSSTHLHLCRCRSLGSTPGGVTSDAFALHSNMPLHSPYPHGSDIIILFGLRF